jgi:hypothetical protein
MKREYWRYFAVTFPYLARRKGQVVAMVLLMLVGAVFALAELALSAVGLVNQPFAILVAVVVALEAGRRSWRTGPGLRRALRRAAP